MSLSVGIDVRTVGVKTCAIDEIGRVAGSTATSLSLSMPNRPGVQSVTRSL
jgi:hypothetical protein